MVMDDAERTRRTEALRRWALAKLPGVDAATPLEKVSDDASFRRYFRLPAGDRNVVVVDAPPDLEDSGPFVAVGRHLHAAGVRVPRQLHVDLEAGFMMLEDFGNELLLRVVARTADADLETAYGRAVDGLVQLAGVDAGELPAYDATLLRSEMALFPEWFCEAQLGLKLDSAARARLENVTGFLVDAALEQPTVFVHRDYHSRNLMVVDDGPLGMIDFQDAVRGPVTYDLVSLVKDCYVRLPRRVVERIAARFHAELADSQTLPDLPAFLRWMDLMGLQRHIKCAGIFSRLNLRDGKPGYLPDIPLVFSYIREAAATFDELRDFDAWLGAVVAPGVATLAGRS